MVINAGWKEKEDWVIEQCKCNWWTIGTPTIENKLVNSIEYSKEHW